MDARITKQRLANLLSYDWLKILGAIVAAVVALCVLFVILTTRPTIAQVYSVYVYGGLEVGEEDGNALTGRLERYFSYDILKVEMQSFDSGVMEEQALTARRGMLEGDAVLVADYTDGEGATPFRTLVGGYTSLEGNELAGFYNIPRFLDDTRTYLAGFFDLPDTEADETFTGGEPIAEKVEEAFYRRNGKDKRFRTAAKKAAGIAEERARLLAIRDNFTVIEEAFARGDLYTVDYTVTVGEHELSFPIGIGLSSLDGLEDLFFYYRNQGDSNRKATDKIVLLFFDNGYRTEEARYENWAFLRYLLDNYAPVHS